MNHGSVLAFSEYVNSGATVWTSVEHTAHLSRADQLVLQAVVYVGTTTSAGTITIAIQHCGDGRNWMPKNVTPELTGTLVSSQMCVFAAGEPWKPRPSLRFVRLAITQTSSIAVRVDVHVTARTFSRVWREPCAGKGEPPTLSPRLGTHVEEKLMKNLQLPLGHRTMAELQRLTHDASHLSPAEQHRHIATHLSHEARKDVTRWIDQLRALPAEEKRQMATNAGRIHMLLSLPASERADLATRAGALGGLLTLLSLSAPEAAKAPRRAPEAGTPGCDGCEQQKSDGKSS